MEFISIWYLDFWLIKDSKGLCVASNCNLSSMPRFKTPSQWLPSHIYKVKLKKTKAKSLYIANNYVSILRYWQ